MNDTTPPVGAGTWSDETEAENFIAEHADDETPEHLTPVITDRGFSHLPPIPHFFADRQFGEIRAYESSNAETPAIWLNVKEGESDLSMTAQLTIENARKLGEQLIWLVDNHYQG